MRTWGRFIFLKCSAGFFSNSKWFITTLKRSATSTNIIPKLSRCMYLGACQNKCCYVQWQFSPTQTGNKIYRSSNLYSNPLACEGHRVLNHTNWIIGPPQPDLSRFFATGSRANFCCRWGMMYRYVVNKKRLRGLKTDLPALHSLSPDAAFAKHCSIHPLFLVKGKRKYPPLSVYVYV